MNLSPALSPTSSHRKAAPRFRSSLLGGTSIAVCLLALARPAGAADGTWTRIATGGLWSDTLNWTGGIVADGIDAHANFGTLNITTDNLVQFDAPRTLGSLTFADVTTATAGSWILSPNSLPGTNVLTLEVSAGSPTITVNGLGAGKVAEIATNIAGVSGFTKAGAGQLVLSGANAYSGPTNVSVGTLRFAKQVSFYNSIPANQTASNLVVSSGATAAFNVGGTGEFTEAEFQTFSRLGTDTGGFLAGSNIGIDTTNAVGPVTLSAGLANPNANLNTLGLAKLGIGTLIINTANTYTGATNVNGGVLRLETNGVINGGAINVAAVTGNQFVVDGGTLTSSALSTINQAGTNNGFLLQSGSATFNGGIRTSTGADGSLIKITGGTFTATDVSVGRDSTTLTSFATGFVVQGGTVNIQTLGLGTTNSLGHGSFEGGTTTIQGAITVGRQSSATGSTVRGGALRVINAGTSFISQDAVDGIIIGRSVGTDGSFGNGSQTADVRFTGGTSTAQKITFQYDSNLTGTGALHVNGGALYLGAGGIVKRDAATGQAISINLTSGLLGAAADWATSLSATTGTTATNNITIKAADQLDAAHNITMGAITGSGGFTKTGGGALIVGGNSTYSGATTISEGTLQVGNGGTTGSLGTSAISNNGTLAFNRTDTALVFANNVTGTGALQHNGTGTTTLTGAGNTYTGNTTINAGTLRVTTSLASPVLTVNNTGTLAGAGPITGAVTVNSGGRLTPDVAGSTTGTLAPGTLTVGALTLASGSTLDFDFSSLSTFDKIQVTNPDSLIINGAGLNLFASNTADRWTIPGNYNLFQYSGALGGTAATNLNSALSVLNPEPTYTYNFSTSGGFITLSIVSPVIIPTWNSTTGGSWNTAGNWTTAVPNGQDVTAKFGNKITAPSTVTLDGNKTLGVLEFGSANSYTIAQGTSGTLTLSKASGNAAIDNTSGSHTISAPVNLASSTVATVFDAVDSLTISGSVSGANALTKSGLGTLVLAASNSYAGGTALTAGTLQIKTTDALSTGSLAVTGVATLQLGADNLTPANSIVLSPIAATIDTQANTATLSGAVSGDGALNKIGSGKLVLTAANTYTGATTISGGILSVPSLADGGLPSPVGQSSNAATNLVLNGGTLEYTGADSTTDRLFRLGTGGGGISSTGAGAVQFLNTGAITLAGSNTARTLTLSGTNTGTNILAATLGNNGTGATSLVKSGPGTWVLSGENTFNGSTVITGGILTLQNSLALGGSTLNYNNQGGLVDFGTLFSITLGGLAGAQNLPLTSAPALTIGGNGQDTTYSGSLTGANGLTKAGSGRLILSGANELAGTVTVSGGTLEVPTGGSLVTPGNISVSTSSALFHQTGGVVNAAQLDLEQGGEIRANATFDGGTATFLTSALGNGATNGASVLRINGGTVGLGSYTSQRDGSNGFNTTGGLVINGGTVTATSVQVSTGNSWSNMNITGGSLEIGTVASDGAFFLGGGTANERGGRLNMTGGSLTYLGVDGLVLNRSTGRSLGVANFTGGTANLSGITLNAATATQGSSTLTVNGGTVYLGAVGLQANITAATASVTLNGGTLGALAPWTGNADLGLGANGVTLQAGDAANSPHDISLVGLLTGNGTLTKTGAGKLTLGGANNTYTGATVVNSGMLLLSGAISGTTSVTVNNASLQLGRADAINDAAGVTLGAATFQTGGFSESVGALTLALASTLDLGAGASVLRFLDSSTATWNGTLSITNWSGSTSGGGTDQLFFGTTASGLSASQLSAVQFIDPNGISGIFSATMLSSGEVIAAVPEPGAFLSLLTGGGLLLGFRRRRA